MAFAHDRRVLFFTLMVLLKFHVFMHTEYTHFTEKTHPCFVIESHDDFFSRDKI